MECQSSQWAVWLIFFSFCKPNVSTDSSFQVTIGPSRKWSAPVTCLGDRLLSVVWQFSDYIPKGRCLTSWSFPRSDKWDKTLHFLHAPEVNFNAIYFTSIQLTKETSKTTATWPRSTFGPKPKIVTILTVLCTESPRYSWLNYTLG